MCVWLGVGPSLAAACPAEDLAAGDAAWLRRAEGASGDGRAQAGPVGDAIDAFERALAGDPECLASYARLLQALFFAGDFASGDVAQKRARFDRAEEVVGAAVAAIARQLGEAENQRAVFDAEKIRARLSPAASRDAGRIHFWSAVALAAWARDHGVLAAVRAGVAGRVHEHGLASLALDPRYEWGGAHRLLAALHDDLPRVPLLTPWVDHERAIPEAEAAFAIAPERPSNRLMLALVLLDRAPARRDEALALLEAVATLDPAPELWVEDAALRKLARERLTQEGGR